MSLEAISSTPIEPQLAHQLDVQTQQINRVLERYDSRAEVTGGEISNHSISYQIQTRLSFGLDRLRSLKNDLLAALRTGDIGVSHGEDGWQLRLSRPEEPPVPLMRLLDGVGHLPPATAAIGLSLAGNPILLRFSASEVTHVLVSGDAGAGKTTLLRAIAAGLALNNRQSDLQLLLIDGASAHDESGRLDESSALYPLTYLPHLLTDPVAGTEVGGEVLHFLASEMDHRREHKVRRPVIIVLIDHLAALLEAGESQLSDDVIRLLQYGPAAGIHFVATTGRADSTSIDVMMRSNMPVRLVGQTADPETAKRAAGIRSSGAENLAGRGDFLALADDECARFQAADISDYDLHYELTQLYRKEQPRLLARDWSERPRMRPKPEEPAETKSKPVPFTAHKGKVEVQTPPRPQPGSRPPGHEQATAADDLVEEFEEEESDDRFDEPLPF